MPAPQGCRTTTDFQLAQPPYLAFSLVSLFLVTSPVAHRLGINIPYERACDAIMLILIGTHAVRLGFALPRLWSAAACSAIFYILCFGAANVLSEHFQLTLFLLDGKIVLCIAALWVFARSPLVAEDKRRTLASLVYFSFCAAIGLFAVLKAGGAAGRLTLLDESNYMMLALCICSIVFIDAHRIRTMSLHWGGVFAMLALASLLAQSRTGFIMIAVIATAMLTRARRYGALIILAYIGLGLGIFLGESVLDSLMRGERDIDQIDRLVFVNELLAQWSSKPWWDVLFGNHIGTYMTNAVTRMHYWVGQQSTEQGIPYGLAPFNFHALFLRLPADLGLVPGSILVVLLFRVLRASVSPYVVLAVLVSCFSMSVFYLSSVLPFIVLAQILRPLPAPAEQQSRRAARWGRADGPEAVTPGATRSSS